MYAPFLVVHKKLYACKIFQADLLGNKIGLILNRKLLIHAIWPIPNQTRFSVL